MHSPEQIVRDFIRAYSAWNERANERCREARERGEPQQVALITAERDYRTLIAQFCAPSVVPQGIAFGSESTHHPDRESLKSADVSANAEVSGRGGSNPSTSTDSCRRRGNGGSLRSCTSTKREPTRACNATT